MNLDSRPATHLVFCDETRYNVGRVRGLGMASAPTAKVARLEGELREMLAASGVAECKWEKVRSARAGFAAAKLLRWALDRTQEGVLRVDTLTWEAESAAQRAAARPYRARLRHMYARLLGDILPRRWPVAERFAVIPDEQGVLAWDALAAELPRVERIVPGRSQDHPLIQLADLFAGLAAYSRDRYTTYDRWLVLPPNARATAGMSAADRVRCKLLDDFFTECKYHRLGVSLRTNWGLRTYDETTAPLGFWWAEAA